MLTFLQQQALKHSSFELQLVWVPLGIAKSKAVKVSRQKLYRLLHARFVHDTILSHLLKFGVPQKFVGLHYNSQVL